MDGKINYFVVFIIRTTWNKYSYAIKFKKKKRKFNKLDMERNKKFFAPSFVKQNYFLLLSKNNKKTKKK